MSNSPAGQEITPFQFLIFFAKNPKLWKYLPDWIFTLKTSTYLTATDLKIPWFTYGAIDYLTTLDLKDRRIFEYGSGGSTLFFSRLGAQLNSVEHDALWHAYISKVLQTFNYSNKVALAEPEISTTRVKKQYKSTTFEHFKLHSFQKYVQSILNYPDNYFDVIVIDGRARLGCAQVAIKKIKKPGIIILDNSERESYKDIFKLYAKYKHTNYFGVGPFLKTFWQTTIWKIDK